MTNYDFKTLNDEDFEILTTDILSAEYSERFQRFKKGRDQGIDGKYYSVNDGLVIFQCKHWPESSLSTLLSSLRNKELPKVKLLKPEKYIFVTSQGLSASNKTEIKTIFSPYILDDSDIYGKEDLNDLLRKYPYIEQSHFKLWLHSAKMLDIFANSAIIGRSNFTLDEIIEKNARYVPTNNHTNALEILDKNNVIIITGEPGIGKTTLAEQICLHYISQDFQLCVGANSIDELESFYKENTKQIFYFDDFLGRNFLEALERHEDTHIVGFIKRINKDSTKRFVLTSRTTVLNRGKSLTELFSHEKINRHEFELEVKSLSAYDKAKILHSCIWYSKLPKSYIEVILTGKKYLEIINHQNFNPRIISFITDPTRLVDVKIDKYWDYITEKLNNPEDIWEHVFFRQLNDYSRVILLLVVFNGRSINEANLRLSFTNAITDNYFAKYTGEQNFDNCIRLLVGSVLNRSINKKRETFYDLFNPSIADYIIKKFSSDSSLLISVFSALNSYDAIIYLDSLIKSRLNNASTATSIIQGLIRTRLPLAKEFDKFKFFSSIVLLGVTIKINDEKSLTDIKKFLLDAISDPNKYSYMDSLTQGYISLTNKNLISSSELENLINSLDLKSIHGPDLELVSSLIPLLEIELGENFESNLKPFIIEYIQDTIQTEIVERDILGDFYNDEDIDEAEKLLNQEIDSILSNYHIKYDHHDFSDIASYCDVLDIINSNIKRSSNDHYNAEGATSMTSSTGEIDELFSIDLPPD